MIAIATSVLGWPPGGWLCVPTEPTRYPSHKVGQIHDSRGTARLMANTRSKLIVPAAWRCRIDTSYASSPLPVVISSPTTTPAVETVTPPSMEPLPPLPVLPMLPAPQTPVHPLKEAELIVLSKGNQPHCLPTLPSASPSHGPNDPSTSAYIGRP